MKTTEQLIEEFGALTRTEMYEYLKQCFPKAARGKSRARKDELIKTYRMGLAYSVNTGTGRLSADRPNEGGTPQPDSPTGRLATEPPVLQHPPSETPEPFDPEKAVMVDADYSAVERRVINAMRPSALEERVEGDRQSRRDVVKNFVKSLHPAAYRMLAQWKAMPRDNRKQRRRRDAVARKIQRRLPEGISLYEVAALVG